MTSDASASFMPPGRPGPEVRLTGSEETEALGQWLGERLQAGEALALSGELGAGKTCLARGLAKGLGVEEPDQVCSPTYLLVMEHPGSRSMLHVDAYLPDKLRGFLEDGGVDYLAETRGVLVVEWAERIVDLLPERTLWARLEAAIDPEVRQVRFYDPAEQFAWIAEIGELFPSC